MPTTDFSAEAFYRFFDYAVERGLFNKNTGESRKTAAKRVLGALKPEELQDLRNLDREMAFTRFQNLKATEFTPSSLMTYKSRFETGLDDFLRWAENPAGFKLRAVKPASTAAKPVSEKKAKPKGGAGAASLDDDKDGIQYAFPVPIRDGKVVVKILNLPTDLSPEEAKRIGGVIAALAVQK